MLEADAAQVEADAAAMQADILEDEIGARAGRGADAAMLGMSIETWRLIVRALRGHACRIGAEAEVSRIEARIALGPEAVRAADVALPFELADWSAA